MRGCQRDDCCKAVAPRAEAERRISTKAHAENDDCGCAALFQPSRGCVDIGKAFEIGPIVNPRGRPAHFRSLNPKASVSNGARELLQLVRRPMLAVHHHDADGPAMR